VQRIEHAAPSPALPAAIAVTLKRRFARPLPLSTGKIAVVTTPPAAVFSVPAPHERLTLAPSPACFAPANIIASVCPAHAGIDPTQESGTGATAGFPRTRRG
jgi:hypothetical protein